MGIRDATPEERESNRTRARGNPPPAQDARQGELGERQRVRRPARTSPATPGTPAAEFAAPRPAPAPAAAPPAAPAAPAPPAAAPAGAPVTPPPPSTPTPRVAVPSAPTAPTGAPVTPAPPTGPPGAPVTPPPAAPAPQVSAPARTGLIERARNRTAQAAAAGGRGAAMLASPLATAAGGATIALPMIAHQAHEGRIPGTQPGQGLGTAEAQRNRQIEGDRAMLNEPGGAEAAAELAAERRANDAERPERFWRNDQLPPADAPPTMRDDPPAGAPAAPAATAPAATAPARRPVRGTTGRPRESDADRLNAGMLANIDQQRYPGARAQDVETVRGLREKVSRGYNSGGKVGGHCRDGVAMKGRTKGRII